MTAPSCITFRFFNYTYLQLHFQATLAGNTITCDHSLDRSPCYDTPPVLSTGHTALYVRWLASKPQNTTINLNSWRHHHVDYLHDCAPRDMIAPTCVTCSAIVHRHLKKHHNSFTFPPTPMLSPTRVTSSRILTLQDAITSDQLVHCFDSQCLHTSQIFCIQPLPRRFFVH